MSKGVKILIVLIVALMVITGIIWFLFFREEEVQPPEIISPEEEAGEVIQNGDAGDATVNGVMARPVSPKREMETPLLNNLTKLSTSFAERFGSYSNQESDYSNIRDLQVFMTDSMKRWSEQYIGKSQATADDDNIYYGVTTKALSTDVLDFNEEDGRAEIMVKTQRRESIDSTSNIQVYYQDIRIVLRKESGDVWKVDGAYWK